ncbi:hypothetical protein M514_01112, partial [Trichuris suis]
VGRFIRTFHQLKIFQCRGVRLQINRFRQRKEGGQNLWLSGRIGRYFVAEEVRRRSVCWPAAHLLTPFRSVVQRYDHQCWDL